jgi:hypothetical protein
MEFDSARNADVGDDLLDGYEDTTEHRSQTPEEKEDCRLNMDLISRQAEKRKEKIDKAHAGTDTSPVEAFHVPAEEDTESNLSDSLARVSSTMSALFAGPPIPAEARRLDRPLTDDELLAPPGR